MFIIVHFAIRRIVLGIRRILQLRIRRDAQDVVVIVQVSSSGREPNVGTLGQCYVGERETLLPATTASVGKLEFENVVVVVGDSGLEWGVGAANVGFAAVSGQRGLIVVVVIVFFGSVVDHGGDVGERVIMFCIGVRIEEHAESLELFSSAKCLAYKRFKQVMLSVSITKSTCVAK